MIMLLYLTMETEEYSGMYFCQQEADFLKKSGEKAYQTMAIMPVVHQVEWQQVILTEMEKMMWQ